MMRLIKAMALGAALTLTGVSIAAAQELSGEITVWDWNYETETWGKALKQVDAQTWDQRSDDVNKAMDRVEDARRDAWDALKDAKKNTQTSMR